jgi:hypothetical protein
VADAAQVAANPNLEALSLLFCGLTYHSTALQPLSQLRRLQSLNLGWAGGRALGWRLRALHPQQVATP